MQSIAYYRKALVAFIGTVVLLVTSALDSFGPYLSTGVTHWISVVVGFVTVVSVYLVRNAAVIDALGQQGE